MLESLITPFQKAIQDPDTPKVLAFLGGFVVLFGGIAAISLTIGQRTAAKYSRAFQAFIASRHGQTMQLSDSKGRDAVAADAEASPSIGVMVCDMVEQAQLTIDGQSWMVAYGDDGFKHPAPVVFWHTHLTQQINGWFRLGPLGSRFHSSMRERDLESSEFNTRTSVTASRPELATAVLPPDFMVWYLQQTDQPWVYLDRDRVVIVFELEPTVRHFEASEAMVRDVIRFIQKSGALEPKP